MIGGDHATDSRGIPVAIDGDRELIQRALLRLSIRKGSFAQDPGLGSELYKLHAISGQDPERRARSYVQEALLPMPEITVADVSLTYPTPGAMRVEVELAAGANTYQLEVDVT